MSNEPRRVWMDTETTGLDLTRRAWEVALIVRDRAIDAQDIEHQWFVHPADIDLEHADPKALEIGRFWDRHPHAPIIAAWREQGLTRPLGMLPHLRGVHRARYVATAVRNLTSGRAQIYGSHPSFDMITVEMMMADEGISPEWHYHPNDVPNLIEGWTIGRDDNARALRIPASRKSEDWCRIVGIEPNNYQRHTALGDCRLFRDAFDAMFRQSS